MSSISHSECHHEQDGQAKSRGTAHCLLLPGLWSDETNLPPQVGWMKAGDLERSLGDDVTGRGGAPARGFHADRDRLRGRHITADEPAPRSIRIRREDARTNGGIVGDEPDLVDLAADERR